MPITSIETFISQTNGKAKRNTPHNPNIPYEKSPLFDAAVPVYVSLTDIASDLRVYVRRDSIVAFYKPSDAVCQKFEKYDIGAVIILDKKLIKKTGHDVVDIPTVFPLQPVLYVKETVAELSTVLPTVLIARG